MHSDSLTPGSALDFAMVRQLTDGVLSRWSLFSIAVLVLMGTGCGTARPALDGQPSPSAPVDEGALRAEVNRWMGTPHRLGGLDRHGVDCSGFVLRVYQTLYDLTLPRVTEDQALAGRQVHRRDLQVGDLVFFRLSRKTRHVGIYLNDGTFAHASSSQGVMISHLDEPYWDRSYWTARRLLSAMGTTSLTGKEAAPSSRRAGW